MYHKSRTFRRYQRRAHIAHKKRICHHATAFADSMTGKGIDFSRVVPMEWYSVDGKYDKGKIHCSCGLCKYGRRYHIPTWRTEKEKARFAAHLAEHNEGDYPEGREEEQ